MKIHEQVRELKHYGPDRQRGTTYAVDDALSKLLPKLALPTMGEAARVGQRLPLGHSGVVVEGEGREEGELAGGRIPACIARSRNAAC